MLFRLFSTILISTETVLATSCDIMCCKRLCHLLIINVKGVAITFHSTGFSFIPEWDSKTPPLIVDKPIEGDLPFRAKIIRKLYRILKFGCEFHTNSVMLVVRYTVDSPVISAVLTFTPIDSLIIQVCQIIKDTSRQEIIFNKTHK